MQPTLEILLLEDNFADAQLLELDLGRSGLMFRLQHVVDEKGFVHALRSYVPDVILSDYSLPQYNGMAALREAAQMAPGVPVIIVTGSINEETAVECMKAGAADYILKPNLVRLAPAIRSTLARRQAWMEKELAEKALRESERRFRNLADTAPVLIWMAGPDAMWTYVNQPWLNFTGRVLGDELGAGWATGVHPEDRSACLGTYRRAFVGRETFQMEFRLRGKDGDYRWVWCHGAPRLLTGGGFAGFVGTCVDITERKQSEKALRASEARKTAIFEAALDCIVTLDHEGRILEFNEAAERVFGLEREEVLGTSLAERVIPSELQEGNRRSLLAESTESGRPGRRVEMTALRADGSEFSAEVAIARIEADGPPLYTAYLRDITERQHHELEREHLIHELQEALGKVKTLSGLLPVCASCKKIRDDQGKWNPMEVYIRQRTDAEFTHGYCPECARRCKEEFEKAMSLGH